ncbi:uncharacterized protein LOC111189704 [Tachysurus ichikawai]
MTNGKHMLKSSKRTLSQSAEALSDDLLNDIIGDVRGPSSDVQRVYDDLRKISTPDQDMRRRVDLCVEISNFVVSRASSRLDGKTPEEEEQEWPEAGSLFNSSTCKSGSFSSILDGASEHSSALNVNRIPVPEPSVFSGDPLKYDWKLSFETLIDQKNIQEKEKIYYLRRYVSGQAKKELEGYFLLGTESAYGAAWEILEERYGNPFTIAKSYKDKLQEWPKMGSTIETALSLESLLAFCGVVRLPWFISKHWKS